jgi:hypothetical protein
MYVDIENRPIKGDDRYSVPGVPGEPYPINTKEDKTGAKRHPPVPSETRSIIGFYRRRYWLAYSSSPTPGQVHAHKDDGPSDYLLDA